MRVQPQSKYIVPEKNIHYQVAEYLRRQYPNILWRSDSGAGMRLTIGQAMAQKRIQNGDRWPDLFIAEPHRKVLSDTGVSWIDVYGLFLEIKKSGTKLKKRNGEWASDHIREQAICHDKLRAKGYKVEFAVGFLEAKSIIDNYLKG